MLDELAPDLWPDLAPRIFRGLIRQDLEGPVVGACKSERFRLSHQSDCLQRRLVLHCALSRSCPFALRTIVGNEKLAWPDAGLLP